MEAMTPSFSKRSKSPGETTWACSMRKRKSLGAWAVWHGGRGHDGVGRELASAALVLRRGIGLRYAGLLGGLEGIEGHVVGAVADGVEAELEAGGGALGGHLVEVVLLVARDAGVAGIVGVGSFHGGGAGAEGAVHEAFEHAEVEAGDR